MKCICLLACLLTIPLARADSIQIPGPITQFSLGGIQSTLYTPWLYSSMWGSTSDFVSDLFMGPFDVGQFAATVPSKGWLQGTTMNYTFNPATDIVSGTFVGTEYVWNQPRTTGLREWTYNVSGTFSEHINFGGQPQGVGYGTALINITSASYAGTSAVPEPGTWLMLGAGAGMLAFGWGMRLQVRS